MVLATVSGALADIILSTARLWHLVMSTMLGRQLSRIWESFLLFTTSVAQFVVCGPVGCVIYQDIESGTVNEAPVSKLRVVSLLGEVVKELAVGIAAWDLSLAPFCQELVEDGEGAGDSLAFQTFRLAPLGSALYFDWFCWLFRRCS